jgi:hypothetical protein
MLLFCQLAYGYAEAINRWNGVTATASSALRDSQGSYPAQNLIDGTYRTWAEGARGNGAGESFAITVENRAQIAGFALKNGYGDLNYFLQNNRVKSFKIYIDNEYIETIPVKDSIHFEQYALQTPVEGKKFQFVIDSVYPGTVYDDTCVAEIALLTVVLSDEDFYNDVLNMVYPVPLSEEPQQYINHRNTIERVSDPDKILLHEYMPFDHPRSKTKIAVLNNPSSLHLSADLPRLDGAPALYPLYSAFVHAVYPATLTLPEEIIERMSSLDDWPYFPNFETMEYIIEQGWTNRNEYFSPVQCNKTSEAYQRLIDGEADLIFCYEPSAAEIEAAKTKGLAFNLTPIAKRRLCFYCKRRQCGKQYNPKADSGYLFGQGYQLEKHNRQ